MSINLRPELDDQNPEWVTRTLQKYVVKKAGADTRPTLGRNTQAEINKLQGVIDVVSSNRISQTEIVRLKQKTQDLLNILTALV